MLRPVCWLAILVGLLAGCGFRSGGPPGSPRGPTTLPPGARRVPPIPDAEIQARQSVYLPIYSHIYVSNNGSPYYLAVTITVRNTDPKRPIVLSSARYLDSKGELIRAYLDQPIELGPLASLEYFIQQSDSRGGTGASLVLDWAAREPVSPPIVEAVMIGTTGSQGISFITRGREIPPSRSP
jgi:hypothetical protein